MVGIASNAEPHRRKRSVHLGNAFAFSDAECGIILFKTFSLVP